MTYTNKPSVPNASLAYTLLLPLIKLLTKSHPDPPALTPSLSSGFKFSHLSSSIPSVKFLQISLAHISLFPLDYLNSVSINQLYSQADYWDL